MYELLAGLLLSLTAAVVGVWGATRRDRPLHGPPDGAALGFPRLQRWDASYRPPRMQRLRSRFPRIQISRFVILFVLVVVVAASAAFIYMRSTENSIQAEQTFEERLGQVGQLRRDAMAASNVESAWNILNDAHDELDEVAALAPEGADDPRVVEERAAIEAQLARLTGAEQAANVQTIGAVPLAPHGVTARLVASDGRAYLLSDAVYQVDVAGTSLIRLLQPGDMVDNAPVETLRAIAWRENRLMAIDATRAYVLDPATGAWVVEPLGAFDGEGFTDIVTGDTFDFNLYLLARESGQILKFQAGLYDGAPEDWTGGLASEELTSAVDMAVDGHVWILLPDGRIMDFFRSRLERTIEPQVAPPLEQTSALAVTSESDYLHLLSSSDGRILRIARDGRVVQHVMTGGDDSPIVGATDLAIDAASGIAYVLANGAIHTLRLPLAPPPDQSLATPRTE